MSVFYHLPFIVAFTMVWLASVSVHAQGSRVVRADSADLKAAPREEVEASAAGSARPSASTNSLGMKFVPVPGTEVAFCVWETRVKDYEEFVKATGQEWTKPNFEQTGDHPAVNVSWEDAKSFCEWLSRKEGRRYRLPTDAEWSVAVGLSGEGGGTPSEKSGKVPGYPWGGQGLRPPINAGNYWGDETETDSGKDALKAAGLGCLTLPRDPVTGAVDIIQIMFNKDRPKSGFSDGSVFTAPVGSYKPNDLGLYDLGGNVREWCEDEYKPSEPWRVLRDESWLGHSNRRIRFVDSLPNRSTDSIPGMLTILRVGVLALQSSWRHSGSLGHGDDDSGFRVVCEAGSGG